MQEEAQGRGRLKFGAAIAAAYVAALTTVTADRLIKDALAATPPAAGGVIFTPWLHLRPTANPHLAYGIPFPPRLTPWLVLLTVAAFGQWWWVACQRRSAATAAALTLIIVGSSSNLVDRIRWGAVVDYLDVRWFTVFNLADVLISVGVGMLVLQELMRWLERRGKGKAQIPNS